MFYIGRYVLRELFNSEIVSLFIYTNFYGTFVWIICRFRKISCTYYTALVSYKESETFYGTSKGLFLTNWRIDPLTSLTVWTISYSKADLKFTLLFGRWQLGYGRLTNGSFQLWEGWGTETYVLLGWSRKYMYHWLKGHIFGIRYQKYYHYAIFEFILQGEGGFTFKKIHGAEQNFLTVDFNAGVVMML